MIRRIAVLAAGVAFAAAVPAAEPEAATPPPPAGPEPQAAAPAGNEARGYVGFGLALVSGTTETPLGDTDSSGGGFAVNGVGHSGKVNPSLDIAFRGEGAIFGREYDGGGGDVADVLVEVDGGLRISELLLLTLGYTTMTTAYENPDVATTYSVVPLGIGVLRTSDAGYVLAQLRIGAGQLGNDQNNDTESVGYVGLRAALQRGSASGVQFMAAVGLDAFDVDDLDVTERFFRLELGLGFGL